MRTACLALSILAVAAFQALGGVREHVICERVSLDGAWEMSYLPYEWSMVELPELTFAAVENAVPGYWEDMRDAFRAAGMKDEFRINPRYVKQSYPFAAKAEDVTFPQIYGTFFYRRKVTLPHGGCWRLAFEGVRNQVHFWLNGRHVAFRRGFSTPFELYIPDGVVRRGENEIVLAVSNNPVLGYCDYETGLATRAVFSSTGGINGHLELRFPRSDVGDVHVTTARDLQSFTVHVSGGARYRYEISRDGRVAAQGEAKGDVTLPAAGYALWSPENPVRYTLRIVTRQGAYEQKFGIRRLTTEGEGFRLNGKPYYLRGVTDHCFFPETIHMPRYIGYYRRLIARRKELGFNFVRLHTYVPPAEYLDAADELGMLVHVESPNFASEPEYAAIVAFARRHPSVVIYCTGNETRIDRLAETYLEDVANIVHSSTDALFTPMSAMRGVEYMLIRGKDEISKTPFPHNRARMKRLARFCDHWTSYQLGATSYDSLNGPSAETIDRWGDAYCGKPRISHEICIDGSWADLSLEALYPTNSPMHSVGMFSGLREQFRARGILDKADLYYRNSCEWMRRIRKFCFEKMRRSRRTSGFDFLGDTNGHWHTFGYSSGMMDEFLRLKPGETVENVLRYNSPAVVLCNLGSDFNVSAGSVKPVLFTVSNFADDAPAATLEASLVDADGKTVWKGTIPSCGTKNGSVADLGRLEVRVPEARDVRRYVLKAVYSGGAVTAANEWVLYAFPREKALEPPKGVRVAAKMGEKELLDALAAGETVLLLGPGPFPSDRMTFRIGLAGRVDGHYATVIKKNHPLFAGLPHEGFCGWQFRRLMEGGRAVRLEGGIPFDPTVDVVSSAKCVVRKSALFEYRVGNGRLLVSSFNLGGTDPAQVWLRNRLYIYAVSPAFAPAVRVTREQIRAAISAKPVALERNKNLARNVNDPANAVRAYDLAQP